MLYRLLALALLTANTAAAADILDITLRDTSAQFQYKSSLGRDPLGKTEFHAGLLYGGKNNAMADFGLLVKDELGNNAPGYSVGVGVKGLLAKVTGDNPVDSSASALAVGGMLKYSPPTNRRVGVVGEGYFSPSIVTYGDADRYVEAGVRLEYELIAQAVVYVGYRRIGFDLKNQPYAVLDQGLNLGVRISF